MSETREQNLVTGTSTTLSMIKMRSRSYTFEPLPDITPYELALATKALLPFLADRSPFRSQSIEIIDNLPPAVKRHFLHHEAQ